VACLVRLYSVDVSGAGGYRRAVTQARRYRYVGPVEIRGQVVASDAVAVETVAGLDSWLVKRDRGDLAEPFTFVVAVDGTLWLAPRRSEHVALAGGQDVLAAGRSPSLQPRLAGASPR
jgi:hypothetical protein